MESEREGEIHRIDLKRLKATGKKSMLSKAFHVNTKRKELEMWGFDENCAGSAGSTQRRGEVSYRIDPILGSFIVCSNTAPLSRYTHCELLLLIVPWKRIDVLLPLVSDTNSTVCIHRSHPRRLMEFRRLIRIPTNTFFVPRPLEHQLSSTVCNYVVTQDCVGARFLFLNFQSIRVRLCGMTVYAPQYHARTHSALSMCFWNNIWSSVARANFEIDKADAASASQAYVILNKCYSTRLRHAHYLMLTHSRHTHSRWRRPAEHVIHRINVFSTTC